MLRAMARMDSRASKSRRNTRRILRLDNLLKPLIIPAEKAKGFTLAGYPAVPDSFRSDSMHDSGGRRKVIGLASESAIGFDRNRRSPWTGIRKQHACAASKGENDKRPGERRAALVPTPQVNLTPYHGVFAPNHRLREQVTPAKHGRHGVMDREFGA